MTTVINNPGGGEGSGMGMMVGILVAVVIIGLFVMYGLPALRNSDNSSVDVNVQLPTGGNSNGY